MGKYLQNRWALFLENFLSSEREGLVSMGEFETKMLILYASEKDFSTANRIRFFNTIKNNDFDCVIMSHDQFGKIPQSPELQREILQAELDSVEENLEVLRGQGKEVSKKMLRGLEKRKANLEAKL